MNTLEILNKLYADGKISQQAFKTYRGQIKHGDESACIIGLKRKHLISDKEVRSEQEIKFTRTS